MNTMQVEVQNLTVRFGEFHAVRDVSFSVQKGEIFGFLGANGAGKTTTIRVLCGLLPPTSGQVMVAGASYAGGNREIKSRVGYMSQKFTLYDDLSIAENLEFAAQLRRMHSGVFKARREHLLGFIDFQRPLDTRVRDLAGGLKQQVSLVAALLHDPDIIFLDEPTAGVSPAARQRFWSLIKELRDRGKTIFVTTHYMDEAEQCGRIALMRAGELIALDDVPGLKKQAFPEPIFELEARGPALSQDEYRQWKQNSGLRSLQAYGIRYHAVPHSQESWLRIHSSLRERFHIREREASLEDVFIELVEGQKSGRASA